MLRSLFLLMAFAGAARAEELTISQVRLTHGVLGPTRTDKRVIPGDSVHVSFTIDGLKTDANGKAKYSATLEILGTDGKVVFRQAAKPQEIINTLGGSQVPAYAELNIGLNQPSGDFVLKLVVTDLTTGQTKTLSHEGKILPKGFGLVRVTTSADAERSVPSGLLGPGQSLYVNGIVVGFDRDKASKQPKLLLECRVLDESGKPTLAEPHTGVVDKGVPPTALSIPVQFLVSLNRPGKFTIEVKATDKVSGKSDMRSFPITVHQP